VVVNNVSSPEFSSWDEVQVLSMDEPNDNDMFGSAVSMFRERMAVGIRYDDGTSSNNDKDYGGASFYESCDR